MKTLNQLVKFINDQDGYPSDVCAAIDANGWHSDDEDVIATDGKMNLYINDNGVAYLKAINEIEIAKQAAELRKSLKMSQRQVAKESGLSHITITRFETSQMDLTSTKLNAYLSALGYELQIVKKAQ